MGAATIHIEVTKGLLVPTDYDVTIRPSQIRANKDDKIKWVVDAPGGEFWLKFEHTKVLKNAQDGPTKRRPTYDDIVDDGDKNIPHSYALTIFAYGKEFHINNCPEIIIQ